MGKAMTDADRIAGLLNQLALERADYGKLLARNVQVVAERDALAAQMAALRNTVQQLADQQAMPDEFWREVLADTTAAASAHDAAIRRATLERAVEIVASMTCATLSGEVVRDFAADRLRAEMDEKQ